MKVIPDDTTRALEVMHGSVDLVINDLNVRDAEHLGSWPGRKLKKAPGLQYEYLGFNHRHPMLKVKEVRQAIAYAINRQVIIDSLLAGLARPAVSPMLPELWSIRADFTSYDYDPDKARSLLDEAGFPDPDGEGPATRFSLEMKCSSRKSSRDLAVVIRQQLRDVGIEVTVKSTEWQTFYADVVNGNFSLYALRWIGIIDPDFFGSIFHSSSIPGEEPPQGKRRGSLNRGRFRNVDVDRLIEAAETELDESMRWRIFADLQHKISEELPYVDLWYRDNFAVMRDDLTGLELTLNASFGVLYKLRYLK
jgi:peptide/nickel transport system substrate-binding protein